MGGRLLSAPIASGGGISRFIFCWAFFRGGMAVADYLQVQLPCHPEKTLRKKPKRAMPPPAALGARTASTPRRRPRPLAVRKIKTFKIFPPFLFHRRAIACALSRLALAAFVPTSGISCPHFLFLTSESYLLAFGIGVVQIHTV